MNLLILTQADFTDNDRALIKGRRLKHLHEVLNVKLGDAIRVGLLGGNLGTAEVISLSTDDCSLSVKLTEKPPNPSNVRLIMGLPRPKVLLRSVTTATELGIKEIYFTHSYRVEKSYWSCEQLEEKRIMGACLKGLEQARDTVLPKIYFKRRFKPFLEDEVPKLIEDTEAWVAHPYASKELPKALSHPMYLAVGPEGGFIDYEIEKFRSTGFNVGTAGARILRVETALPLLMGRISVRM